LSTSTAGYNNRARKEVNFFEKVWTFREPGKGKTETLMPDNYEYPFDVVLDGGLPESIEGLPESWIVYRFKGDIGRKYAKDVQIRKPLRIIRTLGPSALETAHEMVIHPSYSVGTEMLILMLVVS
jgi:arrestin-related trafficking adapter 4/5/7